MEIIIGKTAGFCFGVRNAVDKTYEQLNKIKPLGCLGELVHNEVVIENLKNAGVVVYENINDVPNDSNLIIRAHGEAPGIYEIAKTKNINIIDLTCPRVSKIHEIANDYAKEEYYIVLIAEKKHPETIGTKGYCGQNSCIIENLQDVDTAINDFKNTGLEKIAIIAQTTFSLEKFNLIVEKIKNVIQYDSSVGVGVLDDPKKCNNYELIIKNTICNATATRQAETEELSKQVDLMVIIGGKNSANTKRLYEISVNNCKNVVLIQNRFDEDLINALKQKYKKIGVMAGASTPKECIVEVVEYIKKMEE